MWPILRLRTGAHMNEMTKSSGVEHSYLSYVFIIYIGPPTWHTNILTSACKLACIIEYCLEFKIYFHLYFCKQSDQKNQPKEVATA